jgi:hypothetical protein
LSWSGAKAKKGAAEKPISSGLMSHFHLLLGIFSEPTDAATGTELL